jgi:hypothetical protein
LQNLPAVFQSLSFSSLSLLSPTAPP